MTDFEQLSIDPESLKSYIVLVKDEGIGYRGPFLTYSDLACAWAHFVEMLSKYPGDTSSFKLYCVGEFFPLKADPIHLYDEMIEVTADRASSDGIFDKYLFDLVDHFFTKNEGSIYKLALKSAENPDDLLSDELRRSLEVKVNG